MGVEHCDARICLFVCLSVCLFALISQKPHVVNFIGFPMHGTDGGCSVLLRRRYNALHSSGFISARCNIYIMRLFYDVSVRLSVRLSATEVHWRIIANLGFKFRSQFTAHCGRGVCGREGRDHRREEWRDHLALC